MAAAGLGRLGQWLYLRRTPATPADPVTVPKGTGPLLVLWVSPQAQAARRQVLDILRKARPDLRVLDLSDRSEADRDAAAMAALCRDPEAGNRPRAVLILGGDIPVALTAAAQAADVPVIQGAVRLNTTGGGWGLQSRMRRDLMTGMRHVLVTDRESHQIARNMGLAPSRVTMAGPVAEMLDPLPCHKSERMGFARLLRGRHVWLAACVPPSEERAVIEAHLAALRQSHRALLILAPTSAERVAGLADRLENAGLIVARRDIEEEPTDEVQVMLTDGITEMGLWYRVAPVTYMGGTLSGDDADARHPFEPASLGSAILHGPHIAKFATDWGHLDAAGAARSVSDEAALSQAVADLTQPDLIANLANAAWNVSTGGAGVALQIARPVLDCLDEERR